MKTNLSTDLEAYLINFLYMNFTVKEYKNRLKKVQSEMQKKGIELLISQDTANINYLTGYDAWSFYYSQCVIVHVNSDEPLCFVRAQDAGGAFITTVSYTHLTLPTMRLV